VDNAALLNLDIAWCYLCLRSVGYLPDAQKRLQDCQEMLARTYGPNMERVIALKGTAGRLDKSDLKLQVSISCVST